MYLAPTEYHSDSLVVQAFKDAATREKAFRQLMSRYKQKVYWQVRRVVVSHDDADDVCQNVFIKVWEKLADFREESSLSSWLYRIAHNEALSLLRSKRRLSSLDEVLDEHGELAQLIDSGEYFNGNEIQAKLQKALLTLPEKQRLVFNMKYFDEQKYEEISELLGTSVGALKASYHLAVKKIESFLEQD